MWTATDVGESMVLLALVFLGAALIRKWSTHLRALFLPTAVIGGFLALALGPEGIGRLTHSSGMFPDQTFSVWHALPGLLINVMAASLLLGEQLPAPRKIWGIAGSHVIMAAIMSAGQFAVAGLVVLLLLGPAFGFSDKGGALIELSFAGGHGTLAGLGPVLAAYGAGDLVEVGLGLATIGMVTGVVVGTILVNYAINSPSITVARQNPTSPDEDLDIDHHRPRPGQEAMDEWQGMSQVTAAAVALGVSIAVGMVLLELLRWIFDLFGSDFFEKFPLFPFTIIGGVLVQLVAVRYGFGWAVNRRAVEGLGGLSIDGIIICAIGTLSLAALGNNIVPLVILAVASVGWSIVLALVIGRRVFERDWFEHSIAEFGEGQGNVATGFMMVDMVDPDRKTGVAQGYSYRQLFTRPLVGGGFISALSVPLIAALGLPIFTILTVVITIGLTIWGVRQATVRQSAVQGASVEARG
ncbi:MAG: sodium:glutamate symporter [Chloroflexi bacterium]|nr:sodium:glutamate symporter [Chloroflexota bacterium]